MPGQRLRKTLRSADHDALVATLKDARDQAGLTQQQLADRLGRPQSFVAKYENGERRVDLIEFVALSAALNADPMRLFKAFLTGTKSFKKTR